MNYMAIYHLLLFSCFLIHIEWLVGEERDALGTFWSNVLPEPFFANGGTRLHGFFRKWYICSHIWWQYGQSCWGSSQVCIALGHTSDILFLYVWSKIFRYSHPTSDILIYSWLVFSIQVLGSCVLFQMWYLHFLCHLLHAGSWVSRRRFC
jgi:hypothetical protein